MAASASVAVRSVDAKEGSALAIGTAGGGYSTSTGTAISERKAGGDRGGDWGFVARNVG